MGKAYSRAALGALLTTALAWETIAIGQDRQAPARPTFSADGTAHVPAFDLPPSELSSPEARAAQAMRAKMPDTVPSLDLDIATRRRGLEIAMAPQVARMREAYPVDVADQTIGGVPTRIVTPRGKPFDPHRVLINLHGGGFSMCAVPAPCWNPCRWRPWAGTRS